MHPLDYKYTNSYSEYDFHCQDCGNSDDVLDTRYVDTFLDISKRYLLDHLESANYTTDKIPNTTKNRIFIEDDIDIPANQQGTELPHSLELIHT